MMLEHDPAFDAASHAANAERILEALETVYAAPSSSAVEFDEIEEAVRAFVAHRKALGAPPELVACALRELTLRSAPQWRHWGAYAVLAAAVVRVGLAAYRRAPMA